MIFFSQNYGKPVEQDPFFAKKMRTSSCLDPFDALDRPESGYNYSMFYYCITGQEMAIVLFGNLHRIYAGVISLQRSTSAQQLSNLQEITTPPLIQTKEIQSIRFRKMLLPWLFLNRKTRNNHLFFFKFLLVGLRKKLAD